MSHLTFIDPNVEYALTLYAQGQLSVGKARELAGKSLWEFRQLLAARQIPVHYGEHELETDLLTLHKLACIKS